MNQEEKPPIRKPGTLTFVSYGLGAMFTLASVCFLVAVIINMTMFYLIGVQTWDGVASAVAFVGFLAGVAIFSLIFMVGYRVSELKDTVQRLEIKVNQIAAQPGPQGPAS